MRLGGKGFHDGVPLLLFAGRPDNVQATDVSSEKPRILGERIDQCQTRRGFHTSTKKKRNPEEGCAESTPKEEGGGDTRGNAVQQAIRVSLIEVFQNPLCGARILCVATNSALENLPRMLAN
jgi:hypothetical protein